MRAQSQEAGLGCDACNVFLTYFTASTESNCVSVDKPRNMFTKTLLCDSWLTLQSSPCMCVCGQIGNLETAAIPSYVHWIVGVPWLGTKITSSYENIHSHTHICM